MKPLQQRLQSIDVFRAITMFLMIFINDFGEDKNIPDWVGHAKDWQDKLGFADTIFPTFLFILGLSIPIALQNRIKRGQSNTQIFIYIFLRGLALLVMGIFQVNLENYSPTALLPLPVWEIIITLAFFLIWLDYSETIKKTTCYLLQGLGVVMLIVMAILYKGENEHHLLVSMQPQWYGILGLLGWSYLICAPVYLFSKGTVWVQFLAWLFFFSFSVAAKAGLLQGLHSVHDYIWIIGSGSMPSFTMAGVAVFVLYKKMAAEEKMNLLWPSLFFFAVLNIALGFLTRPLGGISKINDTPSWIGICTGIAILVYIGIIYLVDVKNKKDGFNIIKPAGTVTLTCYLIPYLLYSLYDVAGFHFPAVLSEGWGGFVRSVITSLVVIQIAGWLSKQHIRLKI